MTTCQFIFYRIYLSGDSYIYILLLWHQANLSWLHLSPRALSRYLLMTVLDRFLSFLALVKWRFFVCCGISLFLLKASRTSCVVLLVTCLTLCTTKCTRTWTSPSATTTLLRLTTHTWRGTSSFLSPRWTCMHGCYKRAVGVWKVSGVHLNSGGIG